MERLNASFAHQIEKFCDPDRMGWDVYFPSVVYAYNTNVHSVTKFTPLNPHLFVH